MQSPKEVLFITTNGEMNYIALHDLAGMLISASKSFSYFKL